MDGRYRFRIADTYTPATLPMERLAEYMTALAALLGEGAGVHFGGMEHGSVVLLANADEPVRPKVHDRIRALRDGNAPNDALKAFHQLDNLLRRDNATGTLASETQEVVIVFPGRTRP